MIFISASMSAYQSLRIPGSIHRNIDGLDGLDKLDELDIVSRVT